MYFAWVPYEPDPYGRSPRVVRAKVLNPLADPVTLKADLQGLDFQELASAWLSSDDRLRSESEPSRVLALVKLRALILDEVEQRSPMRYRRWLRRGGPTRERRRHRR